MKTPVRNLPWRARRAANVLPRMIVLVGAVAFLLGAGSPQAYAHSCALSTEAEARMEADVIFEGIALPGPVSEGLPPQGPSRFRVLKYLKGSGPGVVTVSHWFYPHSSVHHRAGDRMIVYARRDAGQLTTSECSGTYRVGDPRPFYEPDRPSNHTWQIALGALGVTTIGRKLMRRRTTRPGASASDRVTPWILDYGDAEEDTVAVSPQAFARISATEETFILIDEDDVESPEDRPWPRVRGDRVIWAAGEGEFDVIPVAIVAVDHAGDSSLFPRVIQMRSRGPAEQADVEIKRNTPTERTIHIPS